jgi:subtilisin-like proprotein convertase family protein
MNRLLGVVATFAVCGCSSGTPGQSEGAAAGLPASAVKQIEALMAEKDARTPAQRKLSSQLLYARNGMPAGVDWKRSTAVQSNAQVDGKGRYLVDVRGDLGDATVTAIGVLGGEVVSTTAARTSARAWVPLVNMEALAASPAVKSIRPALQASTARAEPPRGLAKAEPATRAERVAAVQRAIAQTAGRLAPLPAPGAEPNAGSVTSEGRAGHAVDRARRWFNTTGAGIKVGVLSDSDDWKENAISTGDLGADTVTIPGQDGRPGSGEGTAMMEIVHDVAPGAQLFFASAFNGPESFAENIRSLRFTYGCDVIIDDVIYYFESPYEDDIIAQAVNDVTADGALYFSSAGNGGNANDGTSGTWEGDFAPGGALATLPSGYTVHDFGGGVISNRIEVGGGPLYLHWSDPGTLDAPASSNDYDLFVLDQDLRNVAVASTDIQDGTGLPFEFLGYNIPANYRVVVARKPGAARRAIRVVHSGGELGLATAGSTYGHNSARNAVGAAAVDVAEAGGGEFVAGPTTPVELYSSDGARRVFYNADNSLIRGGATFASEGGELRRHPDLAGADGVGTTLPSGSGLNPFFGTSAAAPHLGAIAALIRAAMPRATTRQIKQAMTSSALDIEASGLDRDTGSGIASAFRSLQAIGAPAGAFLELGATILAPGSGTAFLPGGSGTLTVQVLNSGGARATATQVTLTSSSPFVTVTAGNASLGSLDAGAAATTATPLAFTIAGDAPCGARLPLTLTLTFTGRGPNPVSFPLSVSVGRPGSTPLTVSYAGPPVAIPDDDLAGVDIPLTVSGAGQVAGATFSFDGTACSSVAGSTTVGLAHSWTGDVVARLRSPDGTSVTLVNQAGGANNSGNNFCQTSLDDAAASSIQAITSGGAPWTGTFRPASPLAAFVGTSGDGTWVLNVSDLAFIDTGTVRAFSLSLVGYDCSP